MNLQNFSQLMTHSNIRFSVQSCCANNQFVFKYCPCKSAHWVIKVRYWVNTSLNALIFFFTNQREAENGGEFTYLFNRVICPSTTKQDKHKIWAQNPNLIKVCNTLETEIQSKICFAVLRFATVSSRKFCACHNSTVVLPCAKFSPHHSARMTVQEKWITLQSSLVRLTSILNTERSPANNE